MRVMKRLPRVGLWQTGLRKISAQTSSWYLGSRKSLPRARETGELSMRYSLN
jgi:hypothetical protein